MQQEPRQAALNLLRKPAGYIRLVSRYPRGWFRETVPRYAAETRTSPRCAVDGDWYESIVTCLDELFQHVAHGGLVIVDDYGSWDGCTRAMHDLLSRTSAIEAIRKSRSGVAYLVKA